MTRTGRGTLTGPIRQSAFTLLELIVAMGVMAMLGTALVVMLRSGLDAWRTGQARRETYERAMLVLELLAEDLRSIAAHNPRILERQEVAVKLLADFDGFGRQRLFLVRTIKAESENAITGHAGSEIGATGLLDQRDDLGESRDGMLRPLGGLMEVAWFLDPLGDDVLWRAVCSPIGVGGKSLFEVDATEPDAEGVGTPGSVVSDRVMWLGWRYWTQYTTTWAEDAPPPRRIADPYDPSGGALDWWDSTRGIMDPGDSPPPELFSLFKGRASAADPRDDVFPAKVEVSLTLREDHERSSNTYLDQDLDDGDDRIAVGDASRLPQDGGWVRLGDPAEAARALAAGQTGDDLPVGAALEWLRYSEVEGNELIVEDGGRGLRGTLPVSHLAGTPVEAGRTFVVIVELPAHREDWND